MAKEISNPSENSGTDVRKFYGADLIETVDTIITSAEWTRWSNTIHSKKQSEPLQVQNEDAAPQPKGYLTVAVEPPSSNYSTGTPLYGDTHLQLMEDLGIEDVRGLVEQPVRALYVNKKLVGVQAID